MCSMQSMKNTKFEKRRRQKLYNKDIQLTLKINAMKGKKLNGLQFFAIPLLSHNASLVDLKAEINRKIFYMLLVPFS